MGSRSEFTANLDMQEIRYDPFKGQPWNMDDEKQVLDGKIDPSKSDRYIGKDSLDNHRYADGSSVKVYDTTNIKDVAGKIENVVEKTGWVGKIAVAGVSAAAAVGSSAVEAESIEEFKDNLLDNAGENKYVSAAMDKDHFTLAEMGAKDIAIAAAGAAAGALALTVSAPALVVGALAVGGAVAVGYGVEKLIDYGQDVDFLAVGDNIGDALQTSMTAINGLGGEMKAGALALTADIQELSGNVMEGVAETFDGLKDDYQKAGGISGMFNSAVSSVQNTLASTFNTSAENTVVATVEHQPIAPGMAV